MGEEKRLEVNKEDLHEFRKQVDFRIVTVEHMLNLKPEKGGRELALVRTKLQEAKMWIGKVLEVNGNPLPPELADKV